MTEHEKDLIYTPSEVSDLTLTEIARRSSDKTPGVPFGLPNVDSKMVPLRPGELIVLLGRPSMYKSGLAQWWARNIAEKQLATDDNRVVVYVTTEMAIEELGLYDLAVGARLDASEIARGHISEEDMLCLERAGAHRSALPLWLLGHSLSRRRKRLSINMFSIEKSLYWVEDKMNFTARVIFIDYLNLLDSVRDPGRPPAADRRLAISDIVKCAKDMALNLGCPVVLLAQANRRVDEKDWKLPEMSDGMESASIEQYADKIFSVWYPKVSETAASIVAPNGRAYPITDHLLFFAMIKQKNGPAGGFWPMYVDPSTNEIAMLTEDDRFHY